MFWVGLIIGFFVGGILGCLTAALCVAGSKGEEWRR